MTNGWRWKTSRAHMVTVSVNLKPLDQKSLRAVGIPCVTDRQIQDKREQCRFRW